MFLDYGKYLKFKAIISWSYTYITHYIPNNLLKKSSIKYASVLLLSSWGMFPEPIN